MSENDPIAGLAVDLNEEAKAKRRRKAREPVAEAQAVETQAESGETAEEDGEAILDGAIGWDPDADHTTAVSRMEAITDEHVLDTSAMVADVRDFLLGQIKARPKPWSATSNAEQRDVAAACEHASNELVRKIVEAVVSQGTNSVRVLLTKMTAGSDIVISGKVKTFDPVEEELAVKTLFHAIGKHVMLNVATVEDYRGEVREAETDADEPDFGFVAGGEEE